GAATPKGTYEPGSLCTGLVTGSSGGIRRQRITAIPEQSICVDTSGGDPLCANCVCLHTCTGCKGNSCSISCAYIVDRTYRWRSANNLKTRVDPCDSVVCPAWSQPHRAGASIDAQYVRGKTSKPPRPRDTFQHTQGAREGSSPRAGELGKGGMRDDRPGQSG